MKVYPVALLCRVMGVSRSGFYTYKKRMRSPKSCAYQKRLEARVREIFEASGGSYGSRRISKQLRKDGFPVGRYQARSLMRKLRLVCKQRRRFKVTTDSRHNHSVAPNLLQRQFDVARPNQAWCTDITYVWTLEGWLYLAAVIDLHSRQVVGWTIGERMTTALVKDALMMAIWRRQPEAGLLHHSDRGSQYTSAEYQAILQQREIVVSMSRKGNCWDNSPMERFFGSLKSERLDNCRFTTRAQARAEILDYIGYYNADRLHSSLGYISPIEYEKQSLRKAA